MWRQRVYFRFVMSIVPSPFVSLILISSHFFFLVSKHMYTWQKQQGWWSVVWDSKNWWFCHMLIWSFVHFYFYVNIYSLLSSLHLCLKYQKKIWPKKKFFFFKKISDNCTKWTPFLVPSLNSHVYIWDKPVRIWKGWTSGFFTLYTLGFLDHLHLFCFDEHYCVF